MADAAPSVAQPNQVPSAEPGLRVAIRLVLLLLFIAELVSAVPGIVGLVFVPYGAVGTVLVTRRPRNSIGWILIAIGIGFVLAAFPGPAGWGGGAGSQYSLLGLSPEWTAWVSSQGPMVVFGPMLLLMVVFPSGRLPGGRWGLFVRSALAFVLVLGVLTAVLPAYGVTAEDGTDRLIQNPIGLLPQGPIADLFASGGPMVVVILLLGVGVISMIFRLRRSSGTERQQLKWVVASLAAIALALVFAFAAMGFGADVNSAIWLPAVAAYPLPPLAVGIAMLRYRLYEIDTLVNRTVAYGSATVVLAAGFLLGNLAVQRVAESVTGQKSDLLSSSLAVVAGLSFAPLQRRVRPFADRLLPSRAELTLLFTDLVRSTETIVELGDERWRLLLDRYRATMRAEIARQGGTVVNTAGDAFFATFHDPAQATRAAIEMERGVRRLGLHARTGLHQGEVELRGEQISGLAVHAAARVMAAAGDDEVWVSDSASGALERAGFALEDRGSHELKGVPGERRLYRVELPAA